MKKLLLKKTSILFAMMILFAAQVFAQNQQHIIGNGNIETNYPPNTQVFEYGWSTMLYTSTEAGDAKTIVKIAFDQTIDFGTYWEYAVLENQKIYMKQANIPNFTSPAYEDPDNSANGYTLVFDGTIQFNLGWTEIELTTPFVYDGSSDLIVHYENHRGTSAPIINVKFNATTVTENVFKALGEDGVFPTAFGSYIMERPNIALYYDDDNPATPLSPMPVNNSYKAKVDTDLEFLIGNNTTTYDIYFGTNNPPTDLLISDVSVSSPGSYTNNPSSIWGNLLDSYTQYHWMVVAKDGSNQSSSEVWNFTTQGVIENFPYFTSFEDQPIRSLYADTVDWSWPISGPANWRMVDYSVHSGNYSVTCNVWADAIGEFSMVTPRIYLPANHNVSFWWMMNNGDFSNINVYFEITTDGGLTWELLMEFLPDAPMLEYEKANIDLVEYTGNNVYFRWRYETLSTYVPDYFFLDDVGIDFATGIVENANTNTSFYPNPANNEIRIVSEDKVEQVEIYSIEGKIVYSRNYTGNMVSCDISKLNDGLYIVMIKTNKGTIREKLIVY